MTVVTIPQPVIDDCRRMLRIGSKSFAAASLIFNAEDRVAASLLYGWCRYCDDAIDLPAQEGKLANELLVRLDSLKEKTRMAFDGVSQSEPVFEAMRFISSRYRIPHFYASELLEGMAMDIRRERYETFEELLLYCYRVAGVVGLMMSHIMGLRSEAALRHASDLGSAMQLTNIARDVYEDAAMGRIYLPLGWLREAQVPPGAIARPDHAHRVSAIVARLLERAEAYYRSGDEGLRHLRFRPACAVAGARHVYSAIGREVLRRGARAWESRVWIPSWKKCFLLMRGAFQVLRSLPARVTNPWRSATLSNVWRFT